MDSSDDMDDFEPSLSMSQISRTVPSKKPRVKKTPSRRLLDSQSEGTTEDLSSGEPHPSLPGSSKRPSTVTKKNLIAPPSTSSVTKVRGTSGTSLKVKKQSTALTSSAESSAKSISPVKRKEARSCSTQITSPKQTIKLEHQKNPPFLLRLDSDASCPESSTSSISLSSCSVRSDSGESSNSDSDELPSFSALMDSFAESDKGDQPIKKKTKYFKDLLPDSSLRGKASNAKKPKTMKSTEKQRANRQKSENVGCVRAAKSTSIKKTQRRLSTPSTDPLGDDDEIVIISSGDSSSTEPLTPTIPQSRYPSRSSRIKQKVLDTEVPPYQEGVKVLRTSRKVVSKVTGGELPSPAEATEWFGRDDIASMICGIQKVTKWMNHSVEDDVGLSHLRTPESPSVDDLSRQVNGRALTHQMGSNYSSSSSECETAIQLAAAQYAEHRSTGEKTSGRGVMKSLKRLQSKGAASVTSTTVQPSLAILKLKRFSVSVSVERLDNDSIKRIKKRVSKSYVPPHHEAEILHSNVMKTHRTARKTSSQKQLKRKVGDPHRAPALTVSFDLSLISSPESPSGATESGNLHTGTTDDSGQNECPLWKPDGNKALRPAPPVRELADHKRKTPQNGRQKLQKFVLCGNHSVKENECPKPLVVVAKEQSVAQHKLLTDNETNSTTTVPDKPQTLKRLESHVVTATTTLAPCQAQSLSLNAATTTVPDRQQELKRLEPHVTATTPPYQAQSLSLNADTTTVPDKQQALKQLEANVITATTTLVPYQVQSLSLIDAEFNAEFNAATTALPTKPYAVLAEKPADKHVQRTVPQLPPPYVRHTTLPTESSMMKPPGTRRTAGQNQGGARVLHGRPTKHVCVNTKPKTVRKMDQLYCEVLCWDPTQFMFPQEAQDGQIIRPYPTLTESPVAIPEVFESYEQYCCVFSPLLQLELWEDVSHFLVICRIIYSEHKGYNPLLSASLPPSPPPPPPPQPV